MSDSQSIATGKALVDYDPLAVLKELRAAVGWNEGFVIRLGANQDSYLYKRLVECIAFNEGKQSA